MNYSDREVDIIVADGFNELGYKQKKLFLASVKADNAEREKFAAALIKTAGEGVYNKLKEKFFDDARRKIVLEKLSKHNVVCVTVKSENYPYKLAQTPVPPLVLYLRGNQTLLSRRMYGVVGSRKTSPQIMDECKRLCEQLSEHVAVVTGVADGGDSAAARGAMKNGRAVCVLPGGHDSNSAPNPKLLKRVEENGLSVSEYPPETPIPKHLFGMRNRIIAGLADGVLVVSAGEKSGALSTAAYAADYSRDVFAFPYSIGAELGKGCNKLIKNGAGLCESADDILSSLGIKVESKRSDILLDEGEKAVLDALRAEGEMHAEALAQKLGLKLTDLLTTCSLLEIKGMVIRVGGNAFAALQ